MPRTPRVPSEPEATEARSDRTDDKRYNSKGRLRSSVYEAEMERLQEQLVLLQYWIQSQGLKVLVIFEGRGSAGKGGVIKRITQHISPRIARVIALPAPTEREGSEWYFQRYVAHLPAGGEIAIFDRSWYNRAGVERVMGFCTPDEHRRFLHQCPIFERMLVDDGMLLIKYWFSVSDEEQERRFEARLNDPVRRWKLSETDLFSRSHWVDYSRAKDEMFVHTDIPEVPWWVVEADDKKRARLNCIAHLLSQIPYEPVRADEDVHIPDRQSDEGYVRPPRDAFRSVPDHAATLRA